MRYLVLASDYDGTLARHGQVDRETLEAIDLLLQSGRKLILVTGRELDDLKRVFPELDRCELVVAENGGLLYNPKTQEERPLAEPPNPQFLEQLTMRGVPYSVGRGIVATWEPHQATVLEVIQQLGLELQVSFNKGAVMVLPSGINKQTGLQAALDELGLSAHNVIGIGDAENDHVFLTSCECGVAVANALPSLKERADLVTQGNHGAGVAELIARLIHDDLESFDDQLKRRQIDFGTRRDGRHVYLSPYRDSLLFAGPSGSGKSTAATGVLETLAEHRYQFCLIDPEGDYENFMGATQHGTAQAAPEVKQVLKVLEIPTQNVVINLLGVALEDRPVLFATFLAQLMDLRARTARPHWIVVDEAHHMLPSSFSPASSTMPQLISGLILMTVHPDSVDPSVMAKCSVAIAVGDDPGKTLGSMAQTLSEVLPHVPSDPLEPGEAVVWRRGSSHEVFITRLSAPKTERRRHLRKYAEGELGPDRSFYFCGAENKLNLRASNLQLFSTMADGVDDETWLYHLRRGDYSRWFREAIKDPILADEVQAIEAAQADNPLQSRREIIAALEKHYAAPT